MNIYPTIFRPLLFRLEPEKAHSLTIQLLRLVGTFPPANALLDRMYSAHSHDGKSNLTEGVGQGIEVFGLRFPNRIGLAAGYDKDGLAWRGLRSLGFGHIEVGTVTPKSQDGNPKPRVFRIPEEQAVINRMGFPGRGAEFVAKQLAGNKSFLPTVIGVNIGKNKETPNEEAAKDYLYLLEKFSPLADYLTVNVSSPNTVGLRRLQARDYLENLLKQLAVKRNEMPNQRPILVKLAPDLSDDELDDALAAITTSEMDGVIATNTTIGREGVNSPVRLKIRRA